MPGFVPAISLRRPVHHVTHRDCRDKPGNDKQRTACAGLPLAGGGRGKVLRRRAHVIERVRLHRRRQHGVFGHKVVAEHARFLARRLDRKTAQQRQ